VLDRFGRDGFDSLRVEWQQLHAHQNMPVQLMLADGQTVTGVARGVADDGALLLETVSGVGRHHSGEVSLRAGGVAA
jgi:BirA family biotin operon repressor/biotin-[acetyl-CoA-carboxylase] ligase